MFSPDFRKMELLAGGYEYEVILLKLYSVTVDGIGTLQIQSTTQNCDNEKVDVPEAEKDVVNNTAEEIEALWKSERSAHGTFKNVWLTENEYSDLSNRYLNPDYIVERLSIWVKKQRKILNMKTMRGFWISLRKMGNQKTWVQTVKNHCTVDTRKKHLWDFLHRMTP